VGCGIRQQDNLHSLAGDVLNAQQLWSIYKVHLACPTLNEEALQTLKQGEDVLSIVVAGNEHDAQSVRDSLSHDRGEAVHDLREALAALFVKDVARYEQNVHFF
jgi:hypothetical protein